MDYETCVVFHNLFPYAIFAKGVPLVVQLLRQNLYDAFVSPPPPPLASECFYVIISSSSLFSPLFVRLSLKAKCIAPQPVRYMKLCIIRSSGHESFGLLYEKNEVST